MVHSSKDAGKYKARFFTPLFWNAAGRLTTDPAIAQIRRDADPLTPIVSLVGAKDDDTIPPKGLILAPFHVPALVSSDPGVLDYILGVAADIRTGLSEAYGVDLGFVIWAGMGGSIEDKYAAQAAGLLSPAWGVHVFGLDDVNGETCGHIFSRIESLSGGDLAAGLRRTLVVAQALGMTSLEPVFNVQEVILPEFQRQGLDPSKHFRKVTIPGSLLDQGLQDPVKNVVHQPGGQSTAAGRHDFVSHGMLLPLLLGSGGDGEATARGWCAALDVSDQDIALALDMADWLVAGVEAGVDKVVLRFPAKLCGHFEADGEWRDATLWFKQHFEESLGKTPGKILKFVTTLHGDTTAADRGFLNVFVPGMDDRSIVQDPAARCFDLRISDSVALPLPRLMAIFNWCKYRVAELFGVTAVNQPPVEFYKKLVAFMRHSEANNTAVRDMILEPQCVLQDADRFPGIKVHLSPLVLAGHLSREQMSAMQGEGGRCDLVAALATVHKEIAPAHQNAHGKVYGEYIYFGNLTHGPEAKAMRDLLLTDGAFNLWERAIGSFADVGKGPGVGHATHAMGKQGGVLTASILPSHHIVSHPSCAAYPDEYQRQNAFANVLALAGYDVVDGSLQITGHRGLAFFIAIERNDEATRCSLSKLLGELAHVCA